MPSECCTSFDVTANFLAFDSLQNIYETFILSWVINIDALSFSGPGISSHCSSDTGDIESVVTDV